MPNYNGVWSLTTQYQYAADWSADNQPPVFAFFIGGSDDSATTNIIDTVNINSAGNATDYGDTSAAGERWAGAGSATRAVIGGNYGRSINIYYNVEICLYNA